MKKPKVKKNVKKVRILVIEDNEDNIYLIKSFLKKYEIIEASSGEEGVDLALKEKPDLILMDIQLLGIDGLETTRRIRKSDKKTSIIALTSYAMAGDKQKALKAGCTGYIEKPINPDTFLADVEKYLGKKNENINS